MTNERLDVPIDWKTNSPFVLLKELNRRILKNWKESGCERLPNCLYLHPDTFVAWSEMWIASVNCSLLKFLVDNSVTNAAGGKLVVKFILGALDPDSMVFAYEERRPT